MLHRYYFAKYTAEGMKGFRLVRVWFWQSPTIAINLILDDVQKDNVLKMVNIESFNRVF